MLLGPSVFSDAAAHEWKPGHSRFNCLQQCFYCYYLWETLVTLVRVHLVLKTGSTLIRDVHLCTAEQPRLITSDIRSIWQVQVFWFYQFLQLLSFFLSVFQVFSFSLLQKETRATEIGFALMTSVMQELDQSNILVTCGACLKFQMWILRLLCLNIHV